MRNFGESIDLHDISKSRIKVAESEVRAGGRGVCAGRSPVNNAASIRSGRLMA